MKIEENISLANLNTFKTGGVARYLIRAHSVDDIKNAVLFAREKNIPFFVLGGGSNILISDQGFSGLVIKIEISEVSWIDKGDFVTALIGAGENWDKFVSLAVEKGFYGAENLSGIPGTVGASPVQNIGAYGAEVGNTILWVEIFDTVALETKKLSNLECQFGYRDSIFKKPEGKNFVITRVCFKLSKETELNTNYSDVKKYFVEKNIKDPTISDLRSAILEIRASKLPDLKKYGTAGSFFKNPIISKKDYEELKKKYPEIVSYEVVGQNDVMKVSLAWILDKICGLRGAREGNIGTYENQPLVIVNFGGGTTTEIENLANRIISTVKEKTGIIIEQEVQKLK
ncbi:MAG: UDP-N-acetylmuramate dehydrogenase [Parcubacteria group bacterium]|nr:UDP-N-acetylmuramate dehydrogenase [Parcubacteria group bacterium]